MDDGKKLMAVSKARYRGVTIFETEAGCSFIKDGKQYEFVSLEEATACIDAMCAALATVLATVGPA